MPTGRRSLGHASSSSLEAHVLMVEPVAELVALRRQVAPFSAFGGTSIGTCSTTVSPKPSSPVSFFGLFVRIRIVVSPRSARIWLPIPHSRASAGKPSSRFASTVSRPCLLQLVRLQLVEQADAAALLRHVEQDAALLGRDQRQRELELLAAVAAQRVEDVAGEALGVHAHEHVLGAVDVAVHERDVRLAGERLAEGDRGELAVRGRQRARTSCARRASRCGAGTRSGRRR